MSKVKMYRKSNFSRGGDGMVIALWESEVGLMSAELDDHQEVILPIALSDQIEQLSKEGHKSIYLGQVRWTDDMDRLHTIMVGLSMVQSALGNGRVSHGYDMVSSWMSTAKRYGMYVMAMD